MTAPEQDLRAAFDAVYGPHDWSRPRTFDAGPGEVDAGIYEQHQGLSTPARRAQRRPLPPVPRPVEPWSDSHVRAAVADVAWGVAS